MKQTILTKIMLFRRQMRDSSCASTLPAAPLNQPHISKSTNIPCTSKITTKTMLHHSHLHLHLMQKKLHHSLKRPPQVHLQRQRLIAMTTTTLKTLVHLIPLVYSLQKHWQKVRITASYPLPLLVLLQIPLRPISTWSQNLIIIIASNILSLLSSKA